MTRPPDDAYRQFDRDGRRSPTGQRRVIFTPWLYGERTPVEDHLAPRRVPQSVAVDRPRRPGPRRVEGVALNTRWLLSAVERFTKRRLEPIRFIGGGARSAVWCQIFADVLGREIEQVADPVNAGARGVGMLAAVALRRAHLR